VNRPRITRLPLWVWAAWLTFMAASFALLETIGLLTAADGDTLSEATRRWLGIEPAQPWRIAGMVAFAAALLGFTSWFLPHILFRFGWWTRKPDTRSPAQVEPQVSDLQTTNPARALDHPTDTTGETPESCATSEPQPGTYWERATLERFVTGGPVDLTAVRQQVAALLATLPALDHPTDTEEAE
jgi:hypothetical protein